MGAPSHHPVRGSNLARFGVFEADLNVRELRKRGSRVRLQEQPFAVLAVLLERAGSMVTREELRERLWSSDTFVDFDHSLNTAVNKLREVLGDSAASPRFIETLAKRGYRFLADVEWEHSAAHGSTNALPQDRLHPELEIPTPHRGLIRSLFILLQLMYLVFYVVAVLQWRGIESISWPHFGVPVVPLASLITLSVGIPVRLYLISALAFDHSRFRENFLKIFPGILALDQLWAIAPFLLVNKIGFAAALASTAALLYVPFAERTLVLMAYPQHARLAGSGGNPPEQSGKPVSQ